MGKLNLICVRSVETQKETLRKSQKAKDILELAVSY